MAIHYRRTTQTTCFPEEIDASLSPFPRTAPKEIAHLNDMAGSISDLLSQACGALDAAAHIKQSLIYKIQSIKQEIEGGKKG